MNSVDSYLAYERHALFMAEQGLYPENAPKHRQRIAELEEERRQQYEQYLQACVIVGQLGVTAGPQTYSWFRWMRPDEHIGPRRTLIVEKW